MDEGPLGQREGLCEEPGAEEPMQLLQGLKRSPGGERQWGRVRGVAGRAGEGCGWQGSLVQGSVLCCHVQGLPLKGCKPWSSASRFTFGKDHHVLCELTGLEDHLGTLAALGRC